MNTYLQISKKKKNTCSEIIPPVQTGPICWFMATFVAMFYSQHSRKILIETSKIMNEQGELFNIFKYILKDIKYDYRKLGDNIFERILITLKKFNGKMFPYDPLSNKGFIAEIYIGRLYSLLNINSIIYEYNPQKNWLAYSIFNEEFDDIVSWKFEKNIYSIEEKNYNNQQLKYLVDEYKRKINLEPPPVLIVIVRDGDIDSQYTKLYEEKLHEMLLNRYENGINIDRTDEKEIKSMAEKISYRKKIYTLDSIILANWNRTLTYGHAIAGITCKKKRYIYNGWARENNNSWDVPYACELKEHDWIKNINFCINNKDCIPKEFNYSLEKINEHINNNLCFNFKKGSRLLIYIRNDIISPASSDNSASPILPPPQQSLRLPQPQQSLRLPQSPLLSHLSSSSRSSQSSHLPKEEKDKTFDMILMIMKSIVNVITPFLSKNKTKLYMKTININDIENTDNIFISFIKMMVLLFQKLVNDKISELEFKNEQEKLVNNIISNSNNNLGYSKNATINTTMTNTKNVVSHIITTMYTREYTKELSSNIIKDIPQNSRLYTKFNSLFYKFCLSIYLIILYAQVVGISEDDREFLLENKLTASSRIIQLNGGKGSSKRVKPKKIRKQLKNNKL